MQEFDLPNSEAEPRVLLGILEFVGAISSRREAKVGANNTAAEDPLCSDAETSGTVSK